jgi:hypothetical protein
MSGCQDHGLAQWVGWAQCSAARQFERKSGPAPTPGQIAYFRVSFANMPWATRTP